MTEKEFEENITRLENYYSKDDKPQALTVYEAEEWFREIGKWSKTHFESVIEQCFRDCPRMPKLSDILNCERTFPRQTENKQMQYFHCDKCLSTGVIKYYVRENGVLYDFLARCDCKNSENYMDFPTTEEAGFKVTVHEKDGAIWRKFEHKNGKTKEEIVRFTTPDMQEKFIKQMKENLFKMMKKIS